MNLHFLWLSLMLQGAFLVQPKFLSPQQYGGPEDNKIMTYVQCQKQHVRSISTQLVFNAQMCTLVLKDHASPNPLGYLYAKSRFWLNLQQHTNLKRSWIWLPWFPPTTRHSVHQDSVIHGLAHCMNPASVMNSRNIQIYNLQLIKQNFQWF